MQRLRLFMAVLLLAGTLQAATPYSDLIGKNERTLKRDIFDCRNHICSVSEARYFNDPLLDRVVDKIETYSDERGEIYKIHLYISRTEEYANPDLAEAFFLALKDESRAKGLQYSQGHVSDKYGNKSYIQIVAPLHRKAYLQRLKERYAKALGGYAKQ